MDDGAGACLTNDLLRKRTCEYCGNVNDFTSITVALVYLHTTQRLKSLFVFVKLKAFRSADHYWAMGCRKRG